MIERIESRYGPIYIPDTDNGQYWWLKTTGASPEDEYIELICALLEERPPGITVDAGANFGCWTIPLAKHSIKCVAFEPQKCIFNLLLKTIRDNEVRVDAHSYALGRDYSVTSMPDINLDNSSNFGGIGIGQAHPEHPEAKMYPVDVVPLDAFEIQDVRFIKADVEGSETSLIEGARKTIMRCKPILFVECDHDMTDTQELGKLIESIGYNVEVYGNNFLGMPL